MSDYSLDYSLEVVYNVWNDQTGERYEVSPDPDTGDNITLRFVTDDEVKSNGIYMTPEEASEVHSALSDVFDAMPDFPQEPVVITSKHGDRIEVGEDVEGCELPEIRQYDSSGKLQEQALASLPMMSLVQDALGRAIYDAKIKREKALRQNG